MRTKPMGGGSLERSLEHPILPDVITEPSEQQKHAARHAHTVDDCRQLLCALGLLP